MLPLLIAALLAQTGYRGSSRIPRDSRCSSRDGTCGSSFQLAAEHNFVSLGAASGTAPTCTGDATCVALCYVTSTPEWQCFDNTGAQIGTMSQNGSTFVGSFAANGAKVVNDITGANAPTGSISAIDNLWGQDYTIIGAGFGTTQSDLTFQHFFQHPGFGYIRNDGAFNCQSGAVSATVGNPVVDGWAVWSCRKSGNSHVARWNGGNGSPAVGSDGLVPLSGTSYFGRRSTDTQFPLRGPLMWMAFFNTSKSDTYMQQVEANFFGVTRPMAANSGLVRLAGLDNTALAAGQADVFETGGFMVSRTLGLRIQAGFTNTWAAAPFDASTWTQVSTPTITTNVAAGPFSRWHNTNEGDLVQDTSGAAFQGFVAAASAGAVAGNYTAEFWVSKGTVGTTQDKVRVDWTTDGTGATACNFTGLTTTPQRIVCTTAIGGSPTSVKANLFEGNAAADQGSFIVYHGQQHPTNLVYPPLLNNVAMGDWTQSFDPAAAGWPQTGQHGKYEVLFTPLIDENSQWTAPGTLYLFDANQTPGVTDHSIVMILGYTAPGIVLGSSRNAASQATDIQVSGITLVAGGLYAISTEWTPHGAGHCDIILRLNRCAGDSATGCTATTAIGSVTDGTGICPAQPTKVNLGNRYDNTVPSSGWISAIRVYR